jgi:putative ABC transport system permease protein
MMAIWHYIREFLFDLKVQKTRAILTASAVAWGTMAVSLLLAFGEGLKDRMITSMLNSGERILILYGGQTTKSYRGLPPGRRIRLTEEDAIFLKESIPEIEMISPHYGRWNTRLRYGAKAAVTYAVGVGPPFEIMRRMYPTAGGRFINEKDVQKRRRVVFLGHEIARELFGNESPVGKQLLIEGIPFRVIGVMQKKLQMSMNNGPDSRRAVMPLSTFRTLFGRLYVNQIVIRPREPEQAELLKRKVRRLLALRHRFDPSDSSALPIWDFIEEERIIRAIFLGLQIFLGIVGGLTLFVAGIGVANIMFVIVKERTREIGIKMAVGARKIHIISQFLFEAVAMTGLGGIMGLLGSLIIIFLIRLLPLDQPPLQYLGKPTLSPNVLAISIGALVLIGIMAGLLPARRAASVDPVESLRYE